MKARVEKSRLAVTVPLLKQPRPSKSGKSVIVATSRGYRKTMIVRNGQVVYVIVVAIIKRRPK